MKRSTLLAGASVVALIFAASAFAGSPPKGGHGQGHGHMGWHGDSDARADHMMGKFDLNKDGKITKDEIQRAPKQETDAHFAVMDANRDGNVTGDEFYQAHVAHMREHTDKMYKRLDKSGDGKITRDEFAAAGSKMKMRHQGMMHHGGMDDGDDDED